MATEPQITDDLAKLRSMRQQNAELSDDSAEHAAEWRAVTTRLYEFAVEKMVAAADFVRRRNRYPNVETTESVDSGFGHFLSGIGPNGESTIPANRLELEKKLKRNAGTSARRHSRQAARAQRMSLGDFEAQVQPEADLIRESEPHDEDALLTHLKLKLSAEQLHVFELRSSGQSAAEVANSLKMSRRMVERYWRRAEAEAHKFLGMNGDDERS